MHARKFGMDDKFFEDHGVAFLVGKQALRFSRVPRRGETLTLCSRSEKAPVSYTHLDVYKRQQM